MSILCGSEVSSNFKSLFMERLDHGLICTQASSSNANWQVIVLFEVVLVLMCGGEACDLVIFDGTAIPQGYRSTSARVGT